MLGCAVLLLLVSVSMAFGQRHHFIRPFDRVVAVHRYYVPVYVAPVPFLCPGPYASGYAAAQNYVPPSIQYVFVGSSSPPPRLPLTFKDGTTYFVSDYWREGDQLHFNTLEEGGTKSVPHTVPFDSLDQQRTKDGAVAQGFKFLIRDEPIDQWLAHHGPDRPKTKRTKRVYKD